MPTFDSYLSHARQTRVGSLMLYLLLGILITASIIFTSLFFVRGHFFQSLGALMGIPVGIYGIWWLLTPLPLSTSRATPTFMPSREPSHMVKKTHKHI